MDLRERDERELPDDLPHHPEHPRPGEGAEGLEQVSDFGFGPILGGLPNGRNVLRLQNGRTEILGSLLEVRSLLCRL